MYNQYPSLEIIFHGMKRTNEEIRLKCRLDESAVNYRNRRALFPIAVRSLRFAKTDRHEARIYMYIIALSWFCLFMPDSSIRNGERTLRWQNVKMRKIEKDTKRKKEWERERKKEKKKVKKEKINKLVERFYVHPARLPGKTTRTVERAAGVRDVGNRNVNGRWEKPWNRKNGGS